MKSLSLAFTGALVTTGCSVTADIAAVPDGGAHARDASVGDSGGRTGTHDTGITRTPDSGTTDTLDSAGDGNSAKQDAAGHRDSGKPDAAGRHDSAGNPEAGGDTGSIIDGRVDGPFFVDAGACQSEAPAPCGAGLCGNGAIDTCSIDAGYSFGGYDAGPNGFEWCDGTNLGGATCASLGFAGGVLGCTSGCTFDISGCSACGSDAHILACKNPSVPSNDTTSLAMATNGSQVGLAWISGTGTSGLHIGLLGEQAFNVVAQTGCFGADVDGYVAIASSGAGFMVTNQRFQLPADGGAWVAGLDVYTMSASGTVTSARTISSVWTEDALAGDPSGGALLLWTDSSGHGFASILAADGSVQSTTPTTMTGPLVEQVGQPWNSAAVFVGDGYLAAVPDFTVAGGPPGKGVVAFHVGLDGSLGTMHNLGGTRAGEEVTAPALAWNGSEARASYSDTPPQPASSYWALVTLDGTGSLVGNPVSIGSALGFPTPASIVMSGTDTIALLPTVTALTVSRFSASGQRVGTPYTVASLWGSNVSLANSGSEVVATWIELGANTSDVEMDPSTVIEAARLSP